MKKQYAKILFDLDNTLVDDDENRKYAIEKILIQRKEIVSSQKLDEFIKIDNQYWKDRAEGKIKNPYTFKNNEEKTKWVRAQRFIKYFKDITLQEAIEINNNYVELLKEKIVPIKNSIEILQYLYKKKYELYIITNSPIKVITNKLNKINVQKYIKNTLSSEEVGYMKPHPEFFKAFFKKINCYEREKMLIVGDELEKDILGGIQNGIDTCWFNPKGIYNNKYKIDYEITDLLELKNIL